jgi:hypothetical protein
VLEDELLELGRQPLTLIENALVMNGASRTLDGDVGAEVEIELKGMSAARLYQRTGKRITVSIALSSLREETDMVALAGNDDGELGDLLAAELLEAFLHIADFLLKNGCVLTLTDSVSDEEYTLRSPALADLLHPVLGHESKVLIDVGCGDHLDTISVGLDLSPVTSKVRVGGYSDGGEGSSLTGSGPRSRMRDVGANN